MQRTDPYFRGVTYHRSSLVRSSLRLGIPFLAIELFSLVVHVGAMLVLFRRSRAVLSHYTAAVRYRASAMLGRQDAAIWHFWQVPGGEAILERDDRSTAEYINSRSIPIFLFCLLANLIASLPLLNLLIMALTYLLGLRSFSDQRIYLVLILLWLLFALAGGIYARLIFTIATTGPLSAEEIVQLHRSRREIVDAFEIERRRIERDLHDGAQQYLVAASMKVGEAELNLEMLASSESFKDCPEGESNGESDTCAQIPQILGLLREAQDANDQALAALRRTVAGVHPKVLSDKGLAEAVRDVCAESPVKVDVRMPFELPKLPPGAAAAAYYLVCESLTNVAKYAPQAEVSVLVVAGSSLVVSITDNGAGGASINPGHGLAGLQARLEAFGGTLRVISPTGGPTTVRGEIPIIVSAKETA
ncbi:sensor histidine kinase [Varibaculum cambriense]|nr:histidine kinase [Varibaculum cambriense]MDU5316755.1 histidine kinase [Varibaculum cambriense]MDU5614223.1 histidine kinase [Varibaculum cambriense]MDU6680251.1 histidine kinase [Varibaculum cambriense]MDU7407320.1 histidine kinase [Varibaculum cambriense]